MEDLKTALLLASENGNVDEVTDCVRKGVAINAVLSTKGVFCTRKETALMAAARHGHLSCVNKILQLGADVYSKPDPNNGDDDLKLAMVCAASNCHLECLQVLSEFRLTKGDTIASPYPELMCAAKHRDFDSICDVLPRLRNQKISKGWKGHSLMNLYLLHRCPPWCLQGMMYHGIGINGWDLNGLTPLMCAVLAGNIACIQFLLQHGAHVGATDLVDSFKGDGLVQRQIWNEDGGRSTLMYAAQVGNIQILELLLQYSGEDSSSRDVIDYSDSYLTCTPVMIAASMGNTEAVSLFLRFGADVDYRFTAHDITPIHFAVISGNTECFELLLKNSNEDTAIKVFLCILEQKNPQMFSLFLRYHNKPNLVDVFGYSMLMKATMFDYLEAADVLLRSGHLVNFQNYEGETALLTACWYGRDKSVEWLIRNSANVNAKNDKGYTALMTAAHYNDRRDSNHVRCLQLLIESHANLDFGSNGGTLFTAALTGNITCFEFLLSCGRLLDDNKKLKSVHADAVKKVESYIRFPLRNIWLSIEYNIFDWEWCLHGLNSVVFAALTSGISPGKFSLYNVMISPMILAFMEQDSDSFKYIMANLYFFPEDYTYISRHVAKGDYASELYTRDFSKAVKNFVSQPLSLQTWSFLTISRTISRTDFSIDDRSYRVDSLPLPEGLKERLKFKTYLSSLCYSYWRQVECEEGSKQVTNWLFDRKSFWSRSNSFTKCTDQFCACEGKGQTLFISDPQKRASVMFSGFY